MRILASARRSPAAEEEHQGCVDSTRPRTRPTRSAALLPHELRQNQQQQVDLPPAARAPDRIKGQQGCGQYHRGRRQDPQQQLFLRISSTPSQETPLRVLSLVTMLSTPWCSCIRSGAAAAGRRSSCYMLVHWRSSLPQPSAKRKHQEKQQLTAAGLVVVAAMILSTPWFSSVRSGAPAAGRRSSCC